MNPPRFLSSGQHVPLVAGALALFALFATTFLARPILDPDFFWHLKVGEWLWLHGAWPIPDPFTYTTPANLEQWQIFIVKGYWLNQILYHACYTYLGWAGFFLLRIIVFLWFILILWKSRQEFNWFWFGSSLICITTIFDWYPLERPQFFSVVFFAWLYLFLDRVWSGRIQISRRHIAAVAIVMLAWGNLHRGFILGQCLLSLSAVISIFLITICNKRTQITSPQYWWFVIIGILAGFFNPNAFRYIPTLLQTVFDASIMAKDSSALMVASNLEYSSILKIWQGTGRAIVIPYILFFIMSLAVVLFSFRQQPLFSLVILAGTAVYAAMHVRYLAFFMLAALPVLVRGAESVPCYRIVRWMVVACSVMVLAYLAYDERGNFAKVKAEGWVSNRDFPVEVADALLASNISGRLFNTYGWGGYLLWRLGPERQVFIDGRNLSDQVARDALAAEMVDLGGGRMIWKEVFAKHRISHAILPIISGGRPYALTYALSRDPQWQIAYTSGNAALLTRREPQ